MIIAEHLVSAQKTDFGIEVKRKGTLHSPSRWDGLTPHRLPIGHKCYTNTDTCAAMSCVANDGVLMKPQFISRVFDHSGKTVVHFDPKPVRKVIEPKVSHDLSEKCL